MEVVVTKSFLRLTWSLSNFMNATLAAIASESKPGRAGSIPAN